MHLLSAALALLLAGAGAVAAGPGAALYASGAGAEVRLVGGVRLPATRFACANCHGADGLGSREGATAFPPIAGPEAKVRGAPAIIRAVTEGIAPDGRILGVAMPRYAAPADTLADLAAWVEGLAAAETAGITSEEVSLGPPKDVDALPTMRMAVDRINAGGSLFGRRLVVADDDRPVVLAAAELTDAAAPAVRRAVAALAVARLREMGARAADTGPAAPPEVLDALATSGIAAVAGSPILVCLGQSCPEDARTAIGTLPAVGRRLAAGTAIFVGPAEPDAQVLLSAGLSPEFLGLWIATRALEKAMVQCGRLLTRSCLLRELDSADLLSMLQLYDP